jgi:hypothetical protein
VTRAQLLSVEPDLLEPVDALLARMDRAIAELERFGDGRDVFLFAYRRQTANMRAALVANRFADPRWVRDVTLRFADYYFDAADAWSRSPAACPEPWQRFFRVAHNPRVSAPERLLLGMNAHIVHDLALAIADRLHDADPRQLAVREFDHHMVNEVLEEAIDPMQDALAARYGWWLRALDLALARADEWIVDMIMRAARREAWTAARALVAASAPEQAAAVRRHLVDEALENVERIDLVNHFPLAVVRRVARWIRPKF